MALTIIGRAATFCRNRLTTPGFAIEAKVYRYGWPEDAKVFDGVDCVVMYGDGGGGHMVNAHLAEMDALAKKGVGVVCLHYAVEVPKGPVGEKFLEWIGGYFETDWSVNPHWTAKFSKPSRASDHARRQAVRDQRRMVLSHAVSRGHAGRDADPHRSAACRDAVTSRTVATAAIHTFEPRSRAEKFSTWRGPSNATMAGGALASPAAMCIGIGPIQISAS